MPGRGQVEEGLKPCVPVRGSLPKTVVKVGINPGVR
jgi:hypothetical protein